MSKAIGSILAVVVIIGGMIFFLRNTNQSTNSPSTNPTSASHETTRPTGNPTGTTNTGASAGTSYTLADVAKHAGSTSCWTAINGGVYDLTSWINEHPGGPEAILSLCGKDGSVAFNNQHGGQTRPETELASLKIGTLVQ